MSHSTRQNHSYRLTESVQANDLRRCSWLNRKVHSILKINVHKRLSLKPPPFHTYQIWLASGRRRLLQQSHKFFLLHLIIFFSDELHLRYPQISPNPKHINIYTRLVFSISNILQFILYIRWNSDDKITK